MYNIRHFITIIFTALAVNAFAIDIDNTPGDLAANLIGHSDVTELKVTGALDASDFDFISNSLTELTMLDLSEATIAPYSGERVLTGGSMYAADQLPPFALMGSRLTEIALPSSLKEIGEGALASTLLESVEIPASVVVIGDHAFADCKSLKSVTIPATVEKLGDNLFMGCTSLQSATLAEGITRVGNRMFENCPSLSSVALPSSIKEIGSAAFMGTKALKALSFPAALTAIGDKAFFGSAIADVDLSSCEGLHFIGDFAFAECLKLTSLQFAETASLGRGVFFNDSKLTEITLPATVTVIPEFAFKGTRSVDASIIGESITEIKDYALTGWTDVTNFRIPSSLAKIGSGAMSNWFSAETIDASENHIIPELGENVWQNIDQSDVILYVSMDDLEAYQSTPQWNEFNVIAKKIDSAENVTDDLAADSGISFRYTGSKLLIASANEPIIEVTIFDLGGRTRYARRANAEAVEVDVEAMKTETAVVTVVLADGTSTAAKFIFN